MCHLEFHCSLSPQYMSLPLGVVLSKKFDDWFTVSMQLGSYDWYGFQVMLTYPLYMEFQVSLTCHGRVLLFLINPYIWVFHWCECLNGNVQKPGYWFSLSLSFLLISICSEISFELVYYLRKGLFFLFLKIVSIYIKQE